MTSLMTKLPSLGFRPAGGLSSRLGCHVLGHGGIRTSAVRPWVTRRQVRFSSNDADDSDYEDPRHYETLDVEKSASPLEITAALNKMYFALHSDRTGSKSKEQMELFYKVRAASRVLKPPERRAKYDARHGYNKPAPQPSTSTAEKRPAADVLRGNLRQQAARLREEAQRGKEARAAQAAREAEQRNEERRARELAERRARELAKRTARAAEKQRLAEEERQKPAAQKAREAKERAAAIRAALEKKKAALEKKKADEEEAAIRAARAAEEKKAADEEAAIRAAEKKRADDKAAAHAAKVKKAADRARIDELVWQREREARLVVLRHVPTQTRLWEFTFAIADSRPGRILDMDVARGTAWVEFSTAEQARAFHRTVTETGRFVVRGTTILTAEIRQGRVKLPPGPGLVTRSLYILMPTAFLGGEANSNDLMMRKLSQRGFSTSPVSYKEGDTGLRYWLKQDYASVAHAQSAKAVLEKYYPFLEVSYVEDFCEPPQQSVPHHVAEEELGSSNEASIFDSTLASSSLAVVFGVLFGVIGILMDVDKDKPSDDKTR